MEQLIFLKQLVWNAEEYESAFAAALASAKGQDLQATCGTATVRAWAGIRTMKD